MLAITSASSPGSFILSTAEFSVKSDEWVDIILLNKQEEKIEDKITKTEVKDGVNVYSINLAAVDNSIPYNEIISNQVINYALKFVGNPYVYGGNSLTNGTDCSGFTKLVYAAK